MENTPWTSPTPVSTSTTGPVALIPLRTGGKSRLGTALATEDRHELVLAMLDDVLAALRGARVADIRVLAGDPVAAHIAAARSLTAIPDPPEDPWPSAGDARLRAAVEAALENLPKDRHRLIVAADLPRLTAAEVASILSDPAEVAIAPTAGGGTALLRLAPDVEIPACYGPLSAGAHAAAAEGRAYSVSLLDLPGARHDVDGGSDLEALGRTVDGQPAGPATTAFLDGAHGYPRT